MATTSTTKKSERVWLISGARTASNLLAHMLNIPEQNALNGRGPSGYFFMRSVIKRVPLVNKPLNQWTEEEMSGWQAQAQEDFEIWQDHAEQAAKEGKLPFHKEHALLSTAPYYEVEHALGPEAVKGFEPTTLKMRGVEKGTRSKHNLTVFPDEALHTISPVFIIRHPAFQYPSLYRTVAKMQEVIPRPTPKPGPFEVTYKFNRALFDFYTEYFGKDSEFPIVVDADDYISQPELAKKLASKIGLDPEKVLFSWPKKTEEELAEASAGMKVMAATLYASEGLDKSKVAGDVDIDAEAAKWRVEFGEEEGRELEQWVRDSLPDYEFMKARRLTVD